MTDMLCSLVELSPLEPHLNRLREKGITIRRANPWEQTAVQQFIRENFSQGWADEISVAFTHQPVSCFVAMADKKIIGFAGYECTRKNFFGPTGVAKNSEGQGVGTALLYAGLRGLQSLGYAYAVIGYVSSIEYYQKTVGAMEISLAGGKGIYALREEPELLRK